MTAIHGIASAVVPGLGQLIGGEGKEGVKHMAVNYVATPAMAAGGAVLAQLAANSNSWGNVKLADKLTQDVYAASKKELPKAMQFIKKHPKATAIAGVAIAAGGIVWSAVNYIKSIVNAAKIDKK